MSDIKNQKKYIPEIILDYLHQNGADFISSLPDHHETTIDDVIEYCAEKGDACGRSEIDFCRLVNDAVSQGYDIRYLESSDTAAERDVAENRFIESFHDILHEKNIKAFNDKKIIVVGIGNGTEGEKLYLNVNNVTIIDIAPSSLKQANIILPHAKAFRANASNLDFIADCSYDAYISLRTYQSTYFNMFVSLKEAKRVLKTSGVLIVSIPCGYLNKQRELCFGLINPHTGKCERDRPKLFLNSLIKYIEKLDFKSISQKRILSEIFVYAIK